MAPLSIVPANPPWGESTNTTSQSRQAGSLASERVRRQDHSSHGRLRPKGEWHQSSQTDTHTDRQTNRPGRTQ
jgi:hypothetical protein